MSFFDATCHHFMMYITVSGKRTWGLCVIEYPPETNFNIALRDISIAKDLIFENLHSSQNIEKLKRIEEERDYPRVEFEMSYGPISNIGQAPEVYGNLYER